MHSGLLLKEEHTSAEAIYDIKTGSGQMIASLLLLMLKKNFYICVLHIEIKSQGSEDGNIIHE